MGRSEIRGSFPGLRGAARRSIRATQHPTDERIGRAKKAAEILVFADLGA
jgi:hypothetical protein